MSDLISLMLFLQPVEPDPSSHPIDWWGRAANQMFLNAVDHLDPALSKLLHEGNELKPFTISSLKGRLDHGHLIPGQEYHIRITTLCSDVSKILIESCKPEGVLSLSSIVELENMPFRVTRILMDPEQHFWAKQSDYQTLAAVYLTPNGANPKRFVNLELASPTVFRSNGRQINLPEPYFVFGSLLDRWNAFSPLALPPELRGYIKESIFLSKFNLRSHTVKVKNGLNIGSIGQVSYLIKTFDLYYASLVQILTDFAIFSGIGAKTAFGMGQARRSEYIRQ